MRQEADQRTDDKADTDAEHRDRRRGPLPRSEAARRDPRPSTKAQPTPTAETEHESAADAGFGSGVVIGCAIGIESGFGIDFT